MKLIAFDAPAGARIGQVVGTQVRDLAPIDDFFADPDSYLDPDAVARAVELSSLRLADLHQVPPVPSTARIFCVGVNYPLHVMEAQEAGLGAPEVPMIFGRWPSTLVADGDPVPVPPNEEGLDWEAELAVVIGKKTWCAKEEDALASVLGYTGFNDLSARKKQADTIQWTLGKNADRSGPIGPVVVTADEIGDSPSLEFCTRVNGELRQRANTAEMVHSIARVIAYISDTVTLMPGDVIATGTSDGVGAAMKPPQFLRPGDVVEVEFESIGVLRTPIVGPDEFRPQAPGGVARLSV
ncbi:fumarylacetoacetate hydrolase family protein [Nonomuraea lactucae]|uniref:fumarylacetoacetate hydrolase family protein n=1 Tax=Nonomuraea lactucae TaxID=2249762 RepID=UPI000DE3822A|nr:fumarylacetoacetate hydrolase family protein [Nonomuraea lactucae]